MIKVIEARYLGDFQVVLNFFDGMEDAFDGRVLLERSGSLLEPLQSESYFPSGHSLMLVRCAPIFDSLRAEKHRAFRRMFALSALRGLL